MTSEEREAVALFRYGLIAPILNKHCDRQTYLQEICAQKHNVPYYGLKEFSLSTVERWLSEYRKWGFDELKPKTRGDKGRSRALSDEEQEVVLDSLLQAISIIRCTKLYISRFPLYPQMTFTEG